MPFTVLMSLYAKENPIFLRAALESVFSQSLRSDEVVLVLDGPITEELQDVVSEYEETYSELKIVPIGENCGLGKALNIGLSHCTNDLVVRADTDDICKPNRFSRLVEYMVQNPQVACCSSWIDEFIDTPSHLVATKRVPEIHESIFEYGKSRNPINHPASIFRKQSVLDAGGYQHFPLFEDYYLWVRMLMNGCRMHNIQESLLFFRVSNGMYLRRGGMEYMKTELLFYREMYRLHYISMLRMIQNIVVRCPIRMMPNALRSFIYSHFLRNK